LENYIKGKVLLEVLRAHVNDFKEMAQSINPFIFVTRLLEGLSIPGIHQGPSSIEEAY